MIIKVAITDDHILVRNGIESLLEPYANITLTEKYEDAKSTLEGLQYNQPDVLLLDINLPGMDGIELCKIIHKSYPNISIIGLSNFDETSFVKKILKNGASGYLLKNTSPEELKEAIETVLEGGQFIQQDIQKKIFARSISSSPQQELFIKLTRREKEVLQCIYEELTIQETAEKLFISPKTVETHRMNLMTKFDAKNIVGVIKGAIEMGLISE